MIRKSIILAAALAISAAIPAAADSAYSAALRAQASLARAQADAIRQQQGILHYQQYWAGHDRLMGIAAPPIGNPIGYSGSAIIIGAAPSDTVQLPPSLDPDSPANQALLQKILSSAPQQ